MEFDESKWVSNWQTVSLLNRKGIQQKQKKGVEQKADLLHGLATKTKTKF